MLVSLTTDFSDSGGFVAQLKAQIIKLFGENTTIIDITHNISSFNAVEAAYIVRTAVPRFQPNSIHIVVVDPGVGSKRRIVAAKFSNLYIISPDNEALSLIEPNAVVCIDKNSINPHSSSTFEARDIMVPAAYKLYKNGIESLGSFCALQMPKLFPVKRKNLIKGKIVYVDKFGNCITNIEKNLIADFKEIRIKNLIFSLLDDTYSNNNPAPKALINSYDFLEFALFRDSFAKKFNINYLDDVEVFL